MPLRFDPAVPLDRTPPFVRWTLARACPLREFDDPFDPNRSDRLLRAARTYSNALAEGRVCRGIVVARESAASPHAQGFSIDSALEPLGGVHGLEQVCGECPANAIRRG